ncbi:MAG: hypothetical protein JSW48_13415 [Betaproteobacteria bacterium]|nr:MAG: hypothetical protein JSW48_13415 [Betaproteobacteria bacterium]
MGNDIGNAELSLGDIPSFKETWPRIEPFALTFDGYKYWGTIEKCAEVAARSPATLTHLRTCLFFEARRWAHQSSEPDARSMKRIRALLFAIKEKVKSGDLR